jgi:DNA-binding transcriptional MocR family regulator
MTEGLDLHLGVDKTAGFVERALETALREAIRSRRLHAGARLPGSRSLAADLGISRGTVVQAYTQLVAEGWLTGAPGSGTRVADVPGSGPTASGPDPSPTAARLAIDLRPGRPDLSSFPRTEWASCIRRALSAAPYEDLDYTEPAGLPVLRSAVADYVTRLAVPLEGVAAGLHALLPLESADQERDLIARGRQAGVDLHGLHAPGYWREPGGDRPAALILGYATPPPHAWSRALDALVEVVQGIDS